MRKICFIDIRKAYFNAPAQRDVYVQLPDEALEPGEKGQVCGKLVKSRYGTRDAAIKWEAEYTRVMLQAGFRQGESSPCIFRHSDKDLSVVIHGDDFTFLGPESELKWFASYLKSHFEINCGVLWAPTTKTLRKYVC